MQCSHIAITFLVTLLLGTGCPLTVEIANGAPRVTWIAVQPAVDGVVEVTVWIYDIDRDPVDLEATWSVDGADQGALELAAGGHGLVGLTTMDTPLGDSGRPDPDGQPHQLRWSVEDIPSNTSNVRLSFTPDDRVAAVGETVVSPPFDLDVGLPTVVALEAL